MKEKLKSIEHRFSTHQVQEIMKKEEKGNYYILLNFNKSVNYKIGDFDEFPSRRWRRCFRESGSDFLAHFIRSSGSFLFTATFLKLLYDDKLIIG